MFPQERLVWAEEPKSQGRGGYGSRFPGDIRAVIRYIARSIVRPQLRPSPDRSALTLSQARHLIPGELIYIPSGGRNAVESALRRRRCPPTNIPSLHPFFLKLKP